MDTGERHMTITVTETHTKLSSYERAYNITISRNDIILTGMYASDFLSDCPEDATLSRDLKCIFNAIDFFKLGQKAEKKGEEVVFVTRYENADEEEITEKQFNSNNDICHGDHGV